MANCLDDIAKFANDICGAIDKSGSHTITDAGGNISASVSGIIRQVVGGSVDAGGKKLVDVYENVAREQLANELFNVRDCRQKMAVFAQKEACPRQTVYNFCTDPSFGRASWQHSEDITQSSGWMGGGYDPISWCNDVINRSIAARSIGSDHSAEILDSGENARWTGIRHRQYNYHCSVRLKWDSIYNSKQDPLCGLAS